MVCTCPASNRLTGWISNSVVEFIELYDPKITSINGYRGGPYQQALSGITNLNNNWYDGKGYQIYAFEYTPGAKGDVTWFVGSDRTWKLDARAIGPNGNIGQRLVPRETHGARHEPRNLSYFRALESDWSGASPTCHHAFRLYFGSTRTRSKRV
jgi:hypothetical protein